MTTKNKPINNQPTISKNRVSNQEFVLKLKNLNLNENGKNGLTPLIVKASSKMWNIIARYNILKTILKIPYRKSSPKIKNISASQIECVIVLCLKMNLNIKVIGEKR